MQSKQKYLDRQGPKNASFGFLKLSRFNEMRKRRLLKNNAILLENIEKS